MGFFSWECPCCGHSLRHAGACNETSEWLSRAVYVDQEGNEVHGDYDGYGRVVAKSGLTFELNELPEEGWTLYHEACFRLAGRPKFNPFTKSDSASDQGHFVGEYDPAEPAAVEDCARLKQVARETREREREEARKSHHEYKLKLIAEGKPVPSWLENY